MSPHGGNFWGGGSPMSDTGVTNDMLDAKLTRKRAESDLQLLSNRIALLKLEELKALHKVNETKQRADEIAQIKKRKEDVVKERMQKTLADENRIRNTQIRAQAEREERLRKLHTSKLNADHSKRALVEEVKQEKRRLSQVLQQGRSLSEQDKYVRAQEVRERRQAMQLERERQRQEKEQHAQMMYMQKMAEEAARRREAETRMGNLEREEKELISRLRKTQEMQEKAYAALQKSLRS
eukprot:gene21291-24161_t